MRTEPWLKDQTKGATRAEHKASFRLAPGAHLEVALPTRRTRPRGSFTQMRGELIVDLDELQFVSGHVDIELPSLRMEDQLTLPSPDHTKLDPGLLSSLTTSVWTVQAQNWLGLGSAVSQTDRSETATFTIESAKDLSHPRPHLGAVRKPGSDAAQYQNARVIHATVVGELTMKKRSVARTMSVIVTFYYDKEAASGAVPAALDLQIRGKWDVPLAEYDVRPRDEAGHEQSAMAAVVGPLVGPTAQITGTLRWSRASWEPR